MQGGSEGSGKETKAIANNDSRQLFLHSLSLLEPGSTSQMGSSSASKEPSSAGKVESSGAQEQQANSGATATGEGAPVPTGALGWLGSGGSGVSPLFLGPF